MDVKDYCSKMDQQLSGWKEYISKVIQAADRLPAGERKALVPMIDRLQPLIQAIDSELELLKSSCPADWSPQRKSVDDNLRELRHTLEKLSEKAHGPLVPDSLAWVSA
ncbi:MAG: hypothetical protein R6V84_10695 [Desulfobacterales bacterium]